MTTTGTPASTACRWHYGAAMLVKQTERGDQMFLTMLRRHAAQARDNNALELLP
jgi:hypothetical protein